MPYAMSSSSSSSSMCSSSMPELSSTLDSLDPSNVPSYLLPWLDSTLGPPYTPIHSPKPVFAYKTVHFDLVYTEDDSKDLIRHVDQQERQEIPKKPQTPQPRPHTHTQLHPFTRSAKRRQPNDEQPNNPDGAIPKRQRLDYSHPHITVHIPSSSLVASSTEITTFDPSLASLYPSPSHLNNVFYGAADWNPHFWQSDFPFA